MHILCVLRRIGRTKKVKCEKLDAFVMRFASLWAYEKEKCEKTDAYSMSFALLGADERERVRGSRCFYIIFYTHT